MYLNPEQWFDKHKAIMPSEVVTNFERLRMHIRGWALYEKISEPLAKEMIAHATSKVDDASTIELLYETMTDCANYYIMTLCAEAEALISHSKENVSTALFEDEIKRRNKMFDEELDQESWENSKVLLRETIDIFQRHFLAKKKELMDIESKWWPFYKYSLHFNGMKWQIDAYEIILELRKGKKPNELIYLTHQDDFNAVKELVEAIEEVEKKMEE